MLLSLESERVLNIGLMNGVSLLTVRSRVYRVWNRRLVLGRGYFGGV